MSEGEHVVTACWSGKDFDRLAIWERTWGEYRARALRQGGAQESWQDEARAVREWTAAVQDQLRQDGSQIPACVLDDLWTMEAIEIGAERVRWPVGFLAPSLRERAWREWQAERVAHAGRAQSFECISPGGRFQTPEGDGSDRVIEWIKRGRDRAVVLDTHGFAEVARINEERHFAANELVRGLPQPVPPVQDSVIDVVSKRLDLPACVVRDALTTPEDRLRERARYVEPIVPYPVTDCPRHELGSVRIQPHNTDGLEAYMDYLGRMPSERLVTSEAEGTIRRHPSYGRYREWARLGYTPPYWSVFESVRDGQQRWVATGRRRTLVAQELRQEVTVWIGRQNRETHLPLKWGDVVRAAVEARWALEHAHENRAVLDQKTAQPEESVALSP